MEGNMDDEKETPKEDAERPSDGTYTTRAENPEMLDINIIRPSDGESITEGMAVPEENQKEED